MLRAIAAYESDSSEETSLQASGSSKAVEVPSVSRAWQEVLGGSSAAGALPGGPPTADFRPIPAGPHLSGGIGLPATAPAAGMRLRPVLLPSAM